MRFQVLFCISLFARETRGLREKRDRLIGCLVPLVDLVHLVNQTNEIDQTNQTTVFSNSFLNFAATQTPCTNPNAFGLTVDQRSDWLEVGLEGPLGLVIGMTDIMARLAPFATEIACKSHGDTPLSVESMQEFETLKSTIGPFIVTSRFDGIAAEGCLR